MWILSTIQLVNKRDNFKILVLCCNFSVANEKIVVREHSQYPQYPQKAQIAKEMV